MSKQWRKRIHTFPVNILRFRGKATSPAPALVLTLGKGGKVVKEMGRGQGKETRTRTEPTQVYNSLKPFSTGKICHVNNSASLL